MYITRKVYYKKQKDGFNVVLNALNSYNSRKSEHLKGNKNLLDNAKKLCDGRKIIIDSLKNKVPPFKKNMKMNIKMEMV